MSGCFCNLSYRSSSRRPSPALTNLCCPTSAQPTTRTTRRPSPSQSRRRPCPACRCRSSHRKRGRRGRRSGRRPGWRRRRPPSRGGRCWQGGRLAAALRPPARAKRVRCAARAATRTRSSRRGGRGTRSPSRRGGPTAAATSPGPLT